MFFKKRFMELEQDIDEAYKLLAKSGERIAELESRISNLETVLANNGTKKVDLSPNGKENIAERGYATRYFDDEVPEIDVNWYRKE